MNTQPKTITAAQIADVIAAKFKGKDEITCYVGSNAATPTTSLEALTESIQSGSSRLPFIKMVHLLLQGPVPYAAEGLQDRVMTFCAVYMKTRFLPNPSGFIWIKHRGG
jgi:hypothetical protein